MKRREEERGRRHPPLSRSCRQRCPTRTVTRKHAPCTGAAATGATRCPRPPSDRTRRDPSRAAPGTSAGAHTTRETMGRTRSNARTKRAPFQTARAGSTCGHARAPLTSSPPSIMPPAPCPSPLLPWQYAHALRSAHARKWPACCTAAAVPAKSAPYTPPPRPAASPPLA